MTKKYLESERIYLRPFKKEDFQTIHDALLNPEFRKLTGTQTYLSMEKIENAYESFKNDRSRLDFVIALKETDEAIGDLALNELDHLNNNGNVRIALYKEEHYGKGLGPEALNLVLEYGFEVLNLYRIGLNVYEYNARAIKSYEKLGFVKEGVLRSELLFNGTYYDNYMMSVLRHEYNNIRK
ncbi:N-acetyltransferase [Anaerobacillus alkaliphilus]|uniref:N-acetyltransferase n=1 Tax=Anaerobacillus alkaliphilus TaxID=1548597 RepID=A0A4V1LGX4_9BACI|nr:GNAT family protein [Anaerobacillus alkaliphilus]RXJ04245.1 N-acetyltransferase [Anaerobacillus alkaliphilus]